MNITELAKGAAQGRYLSPADVQKIADQLAEARMHCARLTTMVELLTDAVVSHKPYRQIAEEGGE